MKGKFLRMAISTVLAAALASGCGAADLSGKEVTTPETPYVFWTATDIHYLSPQLTDNGDLFMRVMAAGDSKMTEDSPEILDSFLERAREEKPRALVLTGDLTFNGELVSLKEMTEVLRGFTEETEIPVLLLPGNHDIASYRAYSYNGEEAAYTENISQEEFRELCWEFGPSGALAVDETSFSYVYPLCGDTWLLALDVNTEGAAGRMTEATMAWAEEQLKRAQKEGVTVVSATHQSVLPQNKIMTFGYVISNHDEVAAMLAKYGVRLNLSGHVHLQHQSVEGDLTDIATGSMTVAALRYGVITLTGGGDFTYEMARAGSEEEQARAEARFRARNEAQVDEMLAGLSEKPSDKEAQLMKDFVHAVNYAHFTGEPTGDILAENSEAFALWEKYGEGSRWLLYLQSIRDE